MKKLLKQFAVVTLLLAPVLDVTANEIYWLNIADSYRQADEKQFPAMSIPTTSQDVCSQAMIQYTNEALANFIGCDVKPLPSKVE